MHNTFMLRAIELSEQALSDGSGGPFGAVVVKNNTIIAEGQNRVLQTHDPTAHAEIQAISAACQIIQHFDLSGCEIYSSCEPCPMCLGAIFWARIANVYFAADRSDAANSGFDDQVFYAEINKPSQLRTIKTQQILRDAALKPLEMWKNLENKKLY